jgi:hypothetical protein
MRLNLGQGIGAEPLRTDDLAHGILRCPAGQSLMECGGKRSATPLWRMRPGLGAKAPSPLRSAGALHSASILGEFLAWTFDGS